MFVQRLLAALGLCCLSYGIQAQCTSLPVTEYLETSQVRIGINSNGTIGYDGNPQAMSSHSVPYTSGQVGPGFLFAGSIWLSGVDGGGNVLGAVETYHRQYNQFGVGPLDPSTGSPYPNTCNYNRVWKVDGADIDQFLQDFNDNGRLDQPIPTSLLQWPGRGNPHMFAQLGFSLPANNPMAPFIDFNMDGIYDPNDGDYPVYDETDRNAIPAQMLWTVAHTQNPGLGITPIHLEIQQTVYALDCNTDDLLSQSIFFKHRLLSRNALSVYDMRYGNWNDFDLGCSNDDLVGTWPAQNTIYVYNGDNFDDLTCSPSNPTVNYGTNPPVGACTFLNHSLTRSMHYENSPSTPTGVPYSMVDFFRLLTGSFKDGTPLRAINNGYDATGNAPLSDYSFPGDPVTGAGWSAYHSASAIHDYRCLGVIDFGTLSAGMVLDIDFVYSYHRAPGNSNIQNVALMQQRIPTLKQYYDNGLSNAICGRATNLTSINHTTELEVYPSPTQSYTTIDLKTKTAQQITLVNALGQPVRQMGISTGQVTLERGTLAAGLYTVVVEWEDGSMAQKPLIFQ